MAVSGIIFPCPPFPLRPRSPRVFPVHPPRPPPSFPVPRPPRPPRLTSLTSLTCPSIRPTRHPRGFRRTPIMRNPARRSAARLAGLQPTKTNGFRRTPIYTIPHSLQTLQRHSLAATPSHPLRAGGSNLSHTRPMHSARLVRPPIA